MDGRPVLLQLYDTSQLYQTGWHHRLAYRLLHDGVVIFDGDDVGVPVTDAMDSDETLASVLTFLSLRPADTDREHFDGYTPAQLEWAEHYGENLALRASELRSGRATTIERVDGAHGYPFRAVCTCGWGSVGYAALHAAELMAADHENRY